MRGGLYIYLLMLCAVVLGYCTKDYDVESYVDIKDIVQFGASGIAPSRVTSDDMWESDDEVGIYMFQSSDSTTLDKNVRYYVSGGVGSSYASFATDEGSEIIYPSDTEVSFLCYYPYNSEFLDANLIAYTNTDLLVAIEPNKSSGDVVGFTFDHVMAKVEIAVEAADDLVDLGGLDEMTVTIKSVYSSTYYNPSTEEFTISGDLQEKHVSFTIEVDDDGESATATAILIPCDYNTTVEFVVGEKSYEATFVSTLESGKCSRFTAVLGSDDVVFSADNVTDWNEGASGDLGTTRDFEYWIDVASTAYDWGDGSESNPWRISNSYQLAKLAADVRGGESYEGAYLQLTDDIDLSGADWTAIGTEQTNFKGNFNGKNYWVKGLTISKSTYDGVGLFGYVDGATIQQVGIVECDVDVNYLNVGGLVGSATDSEITTCFVSGSVVGGPNHVGGLVGYSSQTNISESYSSATVAGNNVSYYVGGLVGYFAEGVLLHSNNSGAVAGCSYVGGLVGCSDNSMIVVSYNSGEVSIADQAQNAQSIGGIAGEVKSGYIVASYNTADVDTAATATVTGGLFGSYDGDVVATSCYSSSAGLFGGDYADQLACYYVGDEGDAGTAVATIADLNADSPLEQMNNQIELWNLYNETQLLYYYVAGADDDTPPTLTNGTTDITGVEDWSLMAAPRFASGTGADDDPYIISNGYELAKLAVDVRDGQSYEDKYFKLSATVDLMGGEWTPIGGASHIFKGNFDGDSKSVGNFKITGESSNVGLFGYVYGATIENLTISSCDVSGGNNVGGLVGDAHENSTISNCHVDVTVYGSADLVGGLVGYLVDSVVENCSSAGTVSGNSAGNYYVGGLVGYACDSDDVDDTEVVNSYNRASVIDGTYTGGVLGGATDSDSYSHYRGVTIYGCYNSGTITTTKSPSYAGGVVGRFYDSQMLACYNLGDVTSGDHAGGLIGCVHVNATTTRMSNFFGCYNTGAITGTNSTDALFGFSSISGVNMVNDCYYTSGTQTNGYGESTADLNSKVAYLNNAIAYWNYNCDRQYNYIYSAGSTPTITAGTAEFHFDNWADVGALSYGGGSGSSGDPYRISDGYQLAKLCGGDESYAGIYFKLSEDIDLKGIEWTAIGNYSQPFKGNFDGDGKSISGLKISGSSNYVGLFGFVHGATIEGVTLSGATISGGGTVGGLVGQAEENSYINDCHVEVSVYGSADLVGGLVGSLVDSIVEDCSSAGTVTGNSAGYYYVGGLVGYACDSDDVDDTEVVNSYNAATVVDGTYTGGILGGATDSDGSSHFRGVTIYGCHNSGTVKSTKSPSYAGGVAGRFYDSQMLACYNSGEVTSGDHAGGLIGCVHVNATTTRMSNFFGCYNIGAILGSTSSDALFGYSSIDGVNTVSDCYYVGGTQTNGYGESCADISALNGVVDNLNNAIAYWNQNIDSRQYYYTYAQGDNGPTLVEGTSELNFDNWADVPSISFDGGSGSDSDPYLISDGFQLAKLSCDVKDGESYEGEYFKITANIDLYNIYWSPIGRDGYIFKGNVDGGGHTVSNLKLQDEGSSGSVGLFGYINNSTITDLTVSDYNVTGTICVAALVGRADLSFINNCHVNGSASTVTTTGDYTGGLVGYNVDSSIANSSAAGTVTGTSYVGGLIGYAYQRSGDDDIEIFNCSNSASVNGGSFIGGLLGGAADDDVETYQRGISIYCSYNTGAIATSGSGTRYAGGIAGRFHDGQMVGCYNWGRVTNESGYAGGLIGCVHINATTKTSGFYGCYNRGAVTGTLSSEGLFGTITSLEMVKDCYYDSTTTSTESSGLGVAITSVSALNNSIPYLNSAIATWNLLSIRDINYIYTSVSSDGPTLTAGTPELISDNWIDFAAQSYSGGSGFSSNPYQIANASELARLAMRVASGIDYAGTHFILMADINLMGKQWTPIGSSTTPFEGYFDGDNHTITNVSIYTTNSNQGLFGYVDGATIENVNLSGTLSGTGSLGGLVGCAVGNSTISNCHVDVTVIGTGDLVGGLAGSISDSVVEDCSSAGTVTCSSTNNYYYGGLIGYACDSDDVDDTEVVNCSNSATVVDGTYTGGILGGATDSDSYSHYRGVTIYGCYNSGTITTAKSYAYAGGVAGRFYDSQMVACYNTGSVISQSYAGGLIGCVHVNATTTRMSNFFGCYNTGSVNGSTSDALFGRSNIDGVNGVINCYYVGGSQTNDYGESCSDINAQVDNLNNGIAFWNMNVDRQYGYKFVTGTTPTLTEGVAELNTDEWSELAWFAFGGGSGTEGDPYQIANGCQLAKLSNDVESGESYDGKYFEITANIDLQNKLWSPIGRDGYIFKGNVDGNNHTISNMNVVEVVNPVSGGGGSVGLFGYVEGSTMTDITLSSYSVSGTICVGGLFGRADLSFINNCHVDGSLSSTNNYGGGLVGYLVDSSIANSSSAGTVSGVSYVGGLVGYAYQRSGEDDIEIYRCHNTAAVKDGVYIGGLLGGAADDDVETYTRGIAIYGSYNDGDITAGTSGTRYAGGIAGRFHDGQMVGCYNWGDVTNTSGYAGGLIGCVHINATTKTSGFYGCYNLGGVSGTQSSEALFGMTHSLEAVMNCYYMSSKTDSSGMGTAEFSSMVDRVDDLNTGIAYWNMYSVRVLPFIYTSYSPGPIITDGTPEMIFDNWYDVAALSYAGGSGTESDPYQISDGYQMAKIAVDYNYSSPSSATYFELTADIDLSAGEWTPIRQSSVGLYNIYFEGNNHKISGLTINNGSDYAGLFGRLNSGVLQNIRLVDCNITSGGSYVGGLVGFAASSLYNCSVESGTIHGSEYVGGVIGEASGCDAIEHCYNVGVSVLGSSNVGGVIGYLYDGEIVYACYNEGYVASDSGSSGSYFGGVIGRIYKNNDIAACYNIGKVYAPNSKYIGGVIGSAQGTSGSLFMTITSCFNSGVVTGDYPSDGIVSYAYYYVNCFHSYYLADSNYKNVYGTSCDDYSDLNSHVSTMNSNIPSGSYKTEYEYVAGADPTTQPPTLVEK